MSNNEIFAKLTGLRKQGVRIFLTDDGWREFVKIIQEENMEIEENQAV